MRVRAQWLVTVLVLAVAILLFFDAAPVQAGGGGGKGGGGSGPVCSTYQYNLFKGPFYTNPEDALTQGCNCEASAGGQSAALSRVPGSQCTVIPQQYIFPDLASSGGNLYRYYVKVPCQRSCALPDSYNNDPLLKNPEQCTFDNNQCGVGTRACPDGGLPFRGSCYTYFDNAQTFDGAAQACSSRGGSLVSLVNSDERAFVNAYLANIPGVDNNVWIGLRHTDSSAWVWVDGTAFQSSQAQFASGESTPNGVAAAYLQVSGSTSGRWFSGSTGQTRGYVCKAWDTQNGVAGEDNKGQACHRLVSEGGICGDLGGNFLCTDYGDQPSECIACRPNNEEVCNGIDDDCDGIIDNAFASTEKLTRIGPCTPAAGLAGECAGGYQTCIAEPGAGFLDDFDPEAVWSECEGQKDPISEQCDGKNWNCDVEEYIHDNVFYGLTWPADDIQQEPIANFCDNGSTARPSSSKYYVSADPNWNANIPVEFAPQTDPTDRCEIIDIPPTRDYVLEVVSGTDTPAACEANLPAGYELADAQRITPGIWAPGKPFTIYQQQLDLPGNSGSPGPSNPGPSQQCDFTLDNSCYNILDQSVSWNDARSACQNGFGDLASINSQEENNAVQAQLSSASDRGWIGLRNDGGWGWTDGTSLTHTQWDSGQPSGGGENCAEMYRGSGNWNDQQCNENNLPVCETPVAGAVTCEITWPSGAGPNGGINLNKGGDQNSVTSTPITDGLNIMFQTGGRLGVCSDERGDEYLQRFTLGSLNPSDTNSAIEFDFNINQFEYTPTRNSRFGVLWQPLNNPNFRLIVLEMVADSDGLDRTSGSYRLEPFASGVRVLFRANPSDSWQEVSANGVWTSGGGIHDVAREGTVDFITTSQVNLDLFHFRDDSVGGFNSCVDDIKILDVDISNVLIEENFPSSGCVPDAPSNNNPNPNTIPATYDYKVVLGDETACTNYGFGINGGNWNSGGNSITGSSTGLSWRINNSQWSGSSPVKNGQFTVRQYVDLDHQIPMRMTFDVSANYATTNVELVAVNSQGQPVGRLTGGVGNGAGQQAVFDPETKQFTVNGVNLGTVPANTYYVSFGFSVRVTVPPMGPCTGLPGSTCNPVQDLSNSIRVSGTNGITNFTDDGVCGGMIGPDPALGFVEYFETTSVGADSELCWWEVPTEEGNHYRASFGRDGAVDFGAFNDPDYTGTFYPCQYKNGVSYLNGFWNDDGWILDQPPDQIFPQAGKHLCLYKKEVDAQPEEEVCVDQYITKNVFHECLTHPEEPYVFESYRPFYIPMPDEQLSRNYDGYVDSNSVNQNQPCHIIDNTAVCDPQTGFWYGGTQPVFSSSDPDDPIATPANQLTTYKTSLPLDNASNGITNICCPETFCNHPVHGCVEGTGTPFFKATFEPTGTDTQYVCKDGKWSEEDVKWNPFRDQWGYCEYQSQCFWGWGAFTDERGLPNPCVNSFTNPIVGSPLPSQIGPYMCYNGSWITNAMVLAPEVYGYADDAYLSDNAIGDYTLFCGTLDEAINYVDNREPLQYFEDGEYQNFQVTLYDWLRGSIAQSAITDYPCDLERTTDLQEQEECVFRACVMAFDYRDTGGNAEHKAVVGFALTPEEDGTIFDFEEALGISCDVPPGENASWTRCQNENNYVFDDVYASGEWFYAPAYHILIYDNEFGTPDGWLSRFIQGIIVDPITNAIDILLSGEPGLNNEIDLENIAESSLYSSLYQAQVGSAEIIGTKQVRLYTGAFGLDDLYAENFFVNLNGLEDVDRDALCDRVEFVDNQLYPDQDNFLCQKNSSSQEVVIYSRGEPAGSIWPQLTAQLRVERTP